MNGGDARYLRGRLLALLLLAVLSLGLSTEARAQAQVSCSVSAVGVNFGIYNPLSAAPTLANGQVSATCSLIGRGAARVNVTSSYSTGSSGSYAMRTLRSGTNALNYNLYFDAAFTQIRGDGTGGSQTGSASFTLNSRTPVQSTTSVIYGRIPAGQDVVPGNYSDTIVVTIIY